VESPPILDTNVILRHLRQDHLDHSPRATAFLHQVERGDLRVRIPDTVVFETVFSLESFYGEPRAAIRDVMLSLIALEGVVLSGKRHLSRVFDLYVTTPLSFADAFHAALAERLGGGTIVSFDRHFDRVPGLQRVEP
jgi:predicted nucleic acid-binding protein